MPNIGLPELIVIMMIFMLVFGASRLPQIGEGLGRAIKNLKQGISSDDRIEVSKSEERKPEAAAPASEAAEPKAEQAQPASSDGSQTAASDKDVTDAELVEKS